MSLRLVKFCKPEHNLALGGTTVRLGTPQYYRELDPSFGISDDMEGRELIDVERLESKTADRHALKSLNSAFSNLGEQDVHIEGIRMDIKVPNVYVFSCSILDQKRDLLEHGQTFAEEYTSAYEITEIHDFVQRLLGCLKTNVRIDQFPENVQSEIANLPVLASELTIACWHRPVRYVDKKLADITANVLRSYTRDVPDELRPLFVKPRRYEADREYRVVLAIVHPKTERLFGVRTDPLDLSLLPVRDVPLAKPDG